FRSIVEFIDACVDCNTGRGKPPFAGQSPGNLDPSQPFQMVAMDFAIPLPITHQSNEERLLSTRLFSGGYGAQEIVRHDRDPRCMS
ncbi:TPA: hypothetical protein N0F65_000688, partial [Lagenidium giganteum]